MHGRLNAKEQELAEAQRRIEELQRSQAEPARLAKRQAEVHELEVSRLRERLETAEVKVRSKVAELAALKEELSASRQDAHSADRAMRDQLSQVEERLSVDGARFPAESTAAAGNRTRGGGRAASSTERRAASPRAFPQGEQRAAA